MFSIAAICLAAVTATPAIRVSAMDEADWLYVVKSRASTPEREAEYNAWYDDIDIPDVLEVPGFIRARRAKVVLPSALKAAEPNYVALYDIASNDIDKSIIDLYVAARKMSQLGRLTDVLKVAEANYYRKVADSGPVDAQPVILTLKILCCETKDGRDELLRWYSQALEPAISGEPGFKRVQLFELYRVMEIVALGPEQIPHFLIVVEGHAEAGEIAARLTEILETKMDESTPVIPTADKLVYRLWSEVWR